MPRRRLSTPLTMLAALATAMVPPLAAQQQDFSKVEIKTQAVAGNVYMLEGMGGNIGVSAGPDGVLMIDDQFAPLADKIKAAIEAIGKGDTKFVLNTHWHGDHTGGNPVFGLEALIVAHDNVRKRLSTEQTVRGQKTPPMVAAGLPVITFGESMSIHWNGEEIQLVHAPKGHTDGDTFIYFSKSNVLHMGDHFFNGRFPFVDLGSGGTVQGVERNVKMALDRFPQDVKIIPGHGQLAARADLQKFHRMLVESIATVKAGLSAGKSVEDLQQVGLDSEWKDWGAGFVNQEFWIQTVYDSLRQGD